MECIELKNTKIHIHNCKTVEIVLSRTTLEKHIHVIVINIFVIF